MSDRPDCLKIKEFKLNMMVPNPSIAIIAKRGSGKSFLSRALINHFKNIPGGLIISGTEHHDSYYSKFFPDSFIYPQYSNSLINKLLNRQLKIKKKNKDLKKIGKHIDRKILLLMDDCLACNKSWKNDETLRELLYNGRHYGITYILTMQFPLGISPDLRTNFDYVFFMADDSPSNQKRIFDHYAGIFPSFRAFQEVYNDLTLDNGCMVLVKRSAGASFYEKLYWYKAPVVEPEHVGCNQFRSYHQNNYNSKWEDILKPLNLVSFCLDKKKNKEAIKVDKESKVKLNL